MSFNSKLEHFIGNHPRTTAKVTWGLAPAIIVGIAVYEFLEDTLQDIRDNGQVIKEVPAIIRDFYANYPERVYKMAAEIKERQENA